MPKRVATAISLRQIFMDYELKRLRGKNPGTAVQYYKAIGHLAEFLHREPMADDLSDQPITDCCWWLIRTRGLAIDTAVSYTKKILSLWRYAARHRMIEQWPEVQLPTCPERDPIAWTEAEVRAIYKALSAQQGFIGQAPASLYWCALQLTFWDAPERLAAVLSLRPEDVNLASEPAWATFRAEVRKGQLRDRGYPLHRETAEAIRGLLAVTGNRRLIFEAPFSEETLRQHYKAILKAANLPHDRKRLFHCLRKTSASHWKALGHDATELMDHSAASVTKRYISPQIVRPPRPADQDSGLFRPTG